MQIASKKRWLRAAIIGAAIFAVWFTLGVLTFNEDKGIDNAATRPNKVDVSSHREGAPSFCLPGFAPLEGLGRFFGLNSSAFAFVLRDCRFKIGLSIFQPAEL